MSDEQIKVFSFRLALVPFALVWVAMFGAWLIYLNPFVIAVGFYGFFSAVVQLAVLRNDGGKPASAMTEEPHNSVPTIVGASPAPQLLQSPPQRDDAPASAPLTVQMVAPPVREKPKVNGNHLRLLIDAMNEGRVDPNAISLNSLYKAGVTRFNRGGGADSDAGQLLDYLIEKEAVTPYGQAYAAKQQPYIWRGLDIEL
jgi:hypothetical protein